MKRKVVHYFFNLPVGITAPYVDIINVQGLGFADWWFITQNSIKLKVSVIY